MSDATQEQPKTKEGFPDPRARMAQKIADEEERARRATQSGEAENGDEGPEIIFEQPKPVPTGDSAEDKLMRLMADFDNFRRRSAKERSQERQRGRRDACEKLLPVFDSLTMGLIQLKSQDSGVRGGLEALQAQLVTAFDSLGLKKVPTKGEKFDPELHEAIAHLPSDTVAEGIVMEESRAGFSDDLGLLRPAQVVVSSGQP